MLRIASVKARIHVGVIRHGVENPLENVDCYPIAKALERRVSPSELWRQVPPRAARSRDPQRRCQKQATIATRPARVGHLAFTMRLHPGPLGIRQAQTIHENQTRSRMDFQRHS
jgi:hypothetical protein